MPLRDVFDEAARVLDAAAEQEVVLRGMGGVAIGMRCPSAHEEPLSRPYGDIDFIGDSRQTAAIESLFIQLGYRPENEFNQRHGEYRLFFVDDEHGREADVFLDAIRACHTLELRERLSRGVGPLNAADLLLSKLQVVDTTEKDLKDVLALMTDSPLVGDEGDDGISLSRIREVCCADWGWWRTVTLVGRRALEVADRHVAEGALPQQTAARLTQVLDDLEDAPKSRRWRLRARVGERVRWHEDPEGLEHSRA